MGLVELYLCLLERLLVLQIAGNIEVFTLADYFEAELIDYKHHFNIFPREGEFNSSRYLLLKSDAIH